MSDNNPLQGHPDDAPLVHAKHQPEDAALAAALDVAPRGGSTASWSVTVNRPRQELYRWWLDPAHLATVMENVEHIEESGPNTSRWTVKGPAGSTFSWDSEITQARENDLIAWESRPGASVPNSGHVVFEDADERGTVVTATILYDPPGGEAGKLVAKLFQREPSIQVRRDLCRFKQLMETGEIATNASTRMQNKEESAQ